MRFSTWQLFNGAISRPFRTTDHEPELMYVYPTDFKLPGGWRWRYTGLGIVHGWKVLLAWPLLLGVGITFSCLALIFNALAKGYDFFTYYFTLFLTPRMFLSGVFFPREQLPGGGQGISAWLPLTQAVELIRPLFMDRWPDPFLTPVLVLAAYGLVGYRLALHLTRRRFRL